MKLQRTLLVILLLCLALPSLAAAEQDDFAVEPLEDGGVAITRYRGKVHKLTVPDTLDGQTVTAVRAGAFCDLDVLESVALPDSIVTVEDGAFSRCERLASIYVSPNHPALAAIDGVLFSKSDKRLICYPPPPQRRAANTPCRRESARSAAGRSRAPRASRASPYRIA